MGKAMNLAVHLLDLSVVTLDKSFLVSDLKTGLDPADDVVLVHKTDHYYESDRGKDGITHKRTSLYVLVILGDVPEFLKLSQFIDLYLHKINYFCEIKILIELTNTQKKMKPTLLVLAAGMGSRYGGLKQMDGLGPNGETIIDYSIYDAVHAGFGKVVYIVREYFREQFEQTVKEKYSGITCPDGTPLEFDFVIQELDKIPSGFKLNPERQKPWGTAHAVLMAKDVIHEPFAVINGDDYYGKDSFKILGDWLRAHEGTTGTSCIVGFELDNTLSDYGKVSRGICYYDKDLHLTGIAEHLNIGKEADGKVYGDNSVNGETHVELDGKALCSMNMWGFTPDYFQLSEEVFTSFLEKNINELKKEFYIPYVVDVLMKESGYKCEVLSTDSHWFGVTYKEDRPGVVAKFQELVDKGVYPTPLWKK